MVKFFSKARSRYDGLQSNCKDCKKKDFADYYTNNREHHRAVVNARRARRDEETRKFIWEYLMDHPCVVCEQEDPIVLDFDHIDPRTKLGNVSTLAFRDRVSLRVLKAEIEKCVVMCAYCHRRKTAKEQGWYKSFVDPSE